MRTDLNLSAEGWREIHQLAPPQTYCAATELFRQGFPQQAVYFIRRGLIKLLFLGSDGREAIVNLRGSGRLLGVASAVVRKPYDLTAVTVTRCEIQQIPIVNFLQLVKTDTQFSWDVLQMCSQNIITLNTRLSELAIIPARWRLEHLIWQLISEQGRSEGAINVRLKLPLKHREIAQVIAVTPPYLSQLFKQLAKEGIAQCDNGWLVVDKPQQLWRADDSVPTAYL